MMLEAKDISKSYGSLQVLKNVSLSIEPSEMLCIVGSSGAGKSTLLHLLGTLDKPDTGSLFINGQDLSQFSDRALSKFRNRHIGFVFQAHHLLPEFTALENVCMPAFIANISRKEAEKKAQNLLEILGLSSRLSHKPGQLSGGEQQRVAIARALVNSPAVVFADEPSGNLDSKNADDLHQLFLQLKRDLNQTFVIVTHHEGLARLADRRIVMKDGEVISQS